MTCIPAPLPAREALLARLTYNADGTLTWKARVDDGAIWHESWNARMAGQPAGVIHSSGYVFVSFDNRKFKAHRLIWKMHHGTEPHTIDHINGKPSDNRIENLRPATTAQNMSNTRNRRRMSGLPRGVQFNRRANCISARIQVDKRVIYLGAFPTIAAASAAYEAAAHEYFGPFVRKQSQ